MNDRDKMAKIIREARINASPMAQLGYPEADALINHGAILLPCKVGNTVYVIESCACHSILYRKECQSRCDKRSRKYLMRVEVPTRKQYPRACKCLKLFERPFRIEYLSKIGKNVFLTREEAEKKLEEMRK